MDHRSFKSPKLSDLEFMRLSSFIESRLGIKMPLNKRTMLESRLQGRLRALKIESYKDYITHIFDRNEAGQQELIHFIDVVTTNKTYFFRENDHFDYMLDYIIPKLLQKTNKIKVWSAGCSTGEEPYTICMVMEQYKERHHVDFDYLVLATDISTRVLAKAKMGIYPLSTVHTLPNHIKRIGFLRSKDGGKELVRIKPELRSHVYFKRVNFMDDSFNLPHLFHIAFCRNVVIYFDKETQERLIGKICTQIEPNGFLFLGHSETIMGMNLPLENLAPTTYRRQ